MKRITTLLLGVVLSMGLVRTAFAFDWFDGRLSIGGGYGRAKPEIPYSFKDGYQDGESWTGQLKYFLNNDFSIVASYADLEPYARGNRQDYFRFRPLVGSLRYNLFHHLPITPYITAGAGYSWNKREAPGIVADNWSAFTAQGGVGFEFFITEGTSLGAEALYHDFVGQSHTKPYGMASLMGMANIYFGPGPTAKREHDEAEHQKAEAEKAQAEANASKDQAAAAQQAALAAQQGKAQSDMAVSQATTTAAQAQLDAANAQQKLAQMQSEKAQAQAELDNLKQMMARKDIAPITFKTGSAELVATSNATLDKVGAVIKKYPDLKVRVEGHTDNVGGDEYNQHLSQQRADAVKNYLQQQGGVTESQVTSIGMGKGGPVAGNDTADGRAKNRRVEFIVYIQ